jgi:hypothetical protein
VQVNSGLLVPGGNPTHFELKLPSKTKIQVKSMVMDTKRIKHISNEVLSEA